MIFLGACSALPQKRIDTQQHIQEIIRVEIDRYAMLQETSCVKSAVDISFKEMFSRAILRDSELHLQHIAKLETFVDKKQAKSFRWPRVFAELSLEVPIGNGEDDTDTKTSAGFFLKYDLLKAFFAGESASVETVKREQVKQKIIMRLKALYCKMLRLVAEIEYHRKEIKIYSRAIKIMMAAIRQMTAAEELQYHTHEKIKEWELKLKNVKRKHLRAENAYESNMTLLRQMIGENPCADIIVGDDHIVLPNRAGIGPNDKTEIWDSVARAWHQRTDVRVMEIDLLLAEAAIEWAKRKRLPRLWASFGLGRIILSSGDEAPLVTQLGMSLPIWDMGDTKRDQKKARFHRDKIKEKLVAKAREIVVAVLEADRRLSSSLVRVKETREWLQKEQIWEKTLKKLTAVGRLDRFTLWQSQYLLDEAEIDYWAALAAFQVAAIKLYLVRGDPVPKSLLTEVAE